MNTRFYIYRNDAADGPFTLEQLRGMWRMGAVHGETQVCIEGDEEWTPLGWMEEQLNEPKRIVTHQPQPALTNAKFESAKKVTATEIACAFAIALVALLVVSFITRQSEGDVSLGLIIGLALGFLIYFLPALIAQTRRAENTGAIFGVNFLLGWTGIGYFAALIWACVDRVKAR